MRTLLLIALVLPAVAPAAGAEDPAVHVLRDFVMDFDNRYVQNSSHASAGRAERSGRVELPGIFLHPANRDDATVTFPGVEVPELAPYERCFLLLRPGMRDDIPWDAQPNHPNGVRFSVRVNGETVFSEHVTGEGWRPRAVDMSVYAGESVAVQFATNAVDGNTNYDWAVFGEPMLVRFHGTGELDALPADAVGVAMAQVVCTQPSELTLSMGPASTRAALPEGVHFLPLHFARIAPVTLDVASGAAELTAVQAALHVPQLVPGAVALSSPLVIAGEPVNVVYMLRNVGLGTYYGAGELRLEGAGEPPAPRPIGVIPPGEEKRFIWEGLVFDQPGARSLSAPAPLAFHVFPPAPALSAAPCASPEAEVHKNGPIRAVVATPANRLVFIENAGEAYAVAETWDGAQWRRAASLYPLMHVETLAADGDAEPVDLAAVKFKAKRGTLNIALQGGACKATLAFTPEADTARIAIAAKLEARGDLDLAACYGPRVLAGDRAFGAAKDFAVFPGLEYLERAEPSSSDRDLAYPLCDRRVPAMHKITAPLMAVQGADSLVALMWAPNYAWAPGERHPAARFLAPALDSGLEHIHMSLFAPSVGEYVAENAYAADTPYRMAKGDCVTLEMRLVLDHAARYPAASIVHGPHRGGLALQAMRHWMDCYGGLPEPSDPPRPWDEERALCRHAYSHACWSEDPVGYRHCYGWKPGLYVGHAVHDLLDLRAGLSEQDAAATRARVAKVLDAALEAHGPHYFWTGAGCHILGGELPFFYGYLPESLRDYRDNAFGNIRNGRNQDGLWTWKPAAPKYDVLGPKEGGHTLGQAAMPAFQALRAARLTGDPELRAEALDAMRQMTLYEVPRGAQMWECPLYQPDILAAAYAVRAYCEAYRLTGDPAHLDRARYWAWTGLPFLYLWELDGYPTMRYNVISVIGSTFMTHSWLGLPVVWCGQVYAYALQDFAEFDNSFAWDQIAQGINRSCMWQQYTSGPNKGCYPDSWNMVKNTPNPADIGPENILAIGFREHGPTPVIRCERLERGPEQIMLNANAAIRGARFDPAGALHFALQSTPGYPAQAWIAPVPEPNSVAGAGGRVANSAALIEAAEGWLYDPDLRGVVVKVLMTDAARPVTVAWPGQ